MAKSYSFFIRAESNKYNKNYKNACLDLEKSFELDNLRKNSTINSNFYKFNCSTPFASERKDYYISRQISVNSPCEIKKIKDEKIQFAGEMVNSSFIGCWRKDKKSTYGYGKTYTHIFYKYKDSELGIIAKTGTFDGGKPAEYLTPLDISVDKSCEDCFSKTISATYYIKTTNFNTIRKYRLKDKDSLIVNWEDLDGASSGSYILKRYQKI